MVRMKSDAEVMADIEEFDREYRKQHPERYPDTVEARLNKVEALLNKVEALLNKVVDAHSNNVEPRLNNLEKNSRCCCCCPCKHSCVDTSKIPVFRNRGE